MRTTKQRVVVCAETMLATKQRVKVDSLMQEVHMQATKQLADVAYEAAFLEPDWVEMCMQCSYCSLIYIYTTIKRPNITSPTCTPESAHRITPNVQSNPHGCIQRSMLHP